VCVCLCSFVCNCITLAVQTAHEHHIIRMVRYMFPAIYWLLEYNDIMPIKKTIVWSYFHDWISMNTAAINSINRLTKISLSTSKYLIIELLFNILSNNLAWNQIWTGKSKYWSAFLKSEDDQWFTSDSIFFKKWCQRYMKLMVSYHFLTVVITIPRLNN
jgi:hypothetical protein